MSTLLFEDLEQTYEALALAIDRAGRANESLFLAKLALLLANEVGQFERVKVCLDAALMDLPTTCDSIASDESTVAEMQRSQ